MEQERDAAVEVNFDGLVGQTHNYAGLSFGNQASVSNAGRVSNPKAAALQGLAKMKALMDLGLVQGVIPPQERPSVRVLRTMGFGGSDGEVLEAAWRHDPVLLSLCASASSMWVANAATVSPSADTNDGRIHFTPANLYTKFHRTSEVEETRRLLKAIFADPGSFVHHDPLPPGDPQADEGAANHMRLCSEHGSPGVEVFVYGRRALQRDGVAPSRYPARQTREASLLIARRHGLEPDRAMFVQQRPDVIDKGVFHNDVIAVANRSVLLVHEEAFVDQEAVLERLGRLVGPGLRVAVLPAARVSVEEVVETYLFNSQLVTVPSSGTTVMIAAAECQGDEGVLGFIDELQAQGHVDEVRFFDLQESMRNGGGPACLRLRVVLTGEERARVHQGCLLTEDLYGRLCAWVEAHYRDRLEPWALRDPQLLVEVRQGLDELTGLLGLGSIYDFQQV